MVNLCYLIFGCEFYYYMKVTGKALMIDEIINYVQSLQRQGKIMLQKNMSILGIKYNLFIFNYFKN